MNESVVKGEPLELPFKGSRDYLHGTDLFDALVAKTGAREGLSLRLQHMMRSGVEVIETGALTDRREAAALFAWREEGTTRSVAVREAGHPVTERVRYDEAAVTEKARFGDRFVEWAADATWRPIEALVAHHKVLLQREISSGPWLFTRLELPEWPVQAALLRLEIRQTVGTQTVRSAILSGDRVLGKITFTAKT